MHHLTEYGKTCLMTACWDRKVFHLFEWVGWRPIVAFSQEQSCSVDYCIAIRHITTECIRITIKFHCLALPVGMCVNTDLPHTHDSKRKLVPGR